MINKNESAIRASKHAKNTLVATLLGACSGDHVEALDRCAGLLVTLLREERRVQGRGYRDTVDLVAVDALTCWLGTEGKITPEARDLSDTITAGIE